MSLSARWCFKPHKTPKTASLLPSAFWFAGRWLDESDGCFRIPLRARARVELRTQADAETRHDATRPSIFLWKVSRSDAEMPYILISTQIRLVRIYTSSAWDSVHDYEWQLWLWLWYYGITGACLLLYCAVVLEVTYMCTREDLTWYLWILHDALFLSWFVLVWIIIFKWKSLMLHYVHVQLVHLTCLEQMKH